jgi:hypothetical protein
LGLRVMELAVKKKELSSFYTLLHCFFRKVSQGDLLETSPAVQSATITVVLWNIWKVRNGVVFRSSFATVSVTNRLFVSDLELWAHRCSSPLDSFSLQA